MSFPRAASIAGLATALVVAAGCKRESATKVSSPTAPLPPKVSLVHPERSAVQRVVEQPGTVEAFEQTVLFAKVSGYVHHVCVDIGERVEGPRVDSEGKLISPATLLAEISIPELEEEAKQKAALVKQAQAEVEQAKKAFASAEANIASAQSQVVEARAAQGRAQSLFDRWSSETKRLAGLVESGVMDSQTADETQNQFRAAQASLDEAKAHVTSAEAQVRKASSDRDKAAADVDAAEARVAVAHAESRRIDAMLGYTKIRAPYDGVVTKRSVNTGDFLQPGVKDDHGIFTIARLDPARVVVYVPEADAGLIHEKLPMTLSLSSATTAGIDAVVARTSWSLDPASRTLRVEADVPNSDGKLRPGMYLYARIRTQTPEAWTLPLSAVVKQGDAHVAFRVHDGKFLRTPMKTGPKDDKRITVRQWQEGGSSPQWHDVTSDELFADTAVGLTDGQVVAGTETAQASSNVATAAAAASK